MLFSTFTEPLQPLLLSSFKMFSSPQKRHSQPISSRSPFFPAASPGNHGSTFLSLRICLRWTLSINGITQYVVFYRQVALFSVTLSWPKTLFRFAHKSLWKPNECLANPIFHPCFIMFEYFLPFYCQITFHCINIPYAVYPSIC